MKSRLTTTQMTRALIQGVYISGFCSGYYTFLWRPCACIESRYISLGCFVFRPPSTKVTARNSAKLRYVFGREPKMKMGVQNLGVPPQKRGAQKLPIFGWFYDDMATGDISANVFRTNGATDKRTMIFNHEVSIHKHT